MEGTVAAVLLGLAELVAADFCFAVWAAAAVIEALKLAGKSALISDATADVGVTEEAWELREEQLTRVRNLQLERSRSEQQLNEELREVLDDMGETDKPSGKEPGQK